MNNLIGRSHSCSPSSVESNGEIYTKPKISQIISCRTSMKKSVSIALKCMKLLIYGVGKDCHFEFTPFDSFEVKNCLDNLQTCKASGVDEIEKFLLKISSDIISKPIAIFPNQWKVAKLHPVPKDNKKAFEDENSRPISLLNAISE